jgi:hypothetical protein
VVGGFGVKMIEEKQDLQLSSFRGTRSIFLPATKSAERSPLLASWAERPASTKGRLSVKRKCPSCEGHLGVVQGGENS